MARGLSLAPAVRQRAGASTGAGGAFHAHTRSAGFVSHAWLHTTRPPQRSLLSGSSLGLSTNNALPHTPRSQSRSATSFASNGIEHGSAEPVNNDRSKKSPNAQAHTRHQRRASTSGSIAGGAQDVEGVHATIFVPGTVRSLPNLLAIVAETERLYGPVAEFRCPTAVSFLFPALLLSLSLHCILDWDLGWIRAWALTLPILANIHLSRSVLICLSRFHCSSVCSWSWSWSFSIEYEGTAPHSTRSYPSCTTIQ